MLGDELAALEHAAACERAAVEVDGGLRGATATLDYARRYIALGWHVMPVYTAPGGVCRCSKGAACGSPGKHPDARNGQYVATTDAATVARWFASEGRNIGLACAPSGVIALDADGPREKNGHTDGREYLARLIEELGPLPDTVTADTGSGAEHRIFRDPGPDVETVGKLGKAIDVQRNKLIVIAPSVHASGGVYRWRAGRAPWEHATAELPPAWIEHLRAPEPKTEPAVSSGAASGDDFFAALASLDQRYVLQCLSGSALVNGERFAFKRTKAGKYNLLVDRGDGWQATSNYIDANGRIAARSTGRGADDGGPLASTWCRYYDKDDKAIYRGLIDAVPELARFAERKTQSSHKEVEPTIPDAKHPNGPNGNGALHPAELVDGEVIYERRRERVQADRAAHIDAEEAAAMHEEATGAWSPPEPPDDTPSEREREPPPTTAPPPDIGEPTGPDAPPPIDESDAAGDESPNAPWRGGNGPAALAFEFIRKHARHADGPTLRKWRGEYYGWTAERGCYAVRTDDQIVSQLQRKLRLSDPSAVRDVRASLIAVDDVLIDHVELGSWIDSAPSECDPLDLCATRNGLLHLPTRKLYTSTPRYFATSVLGTVYDSKAKRPEEWHKFLRQLWPTDDESIRLLQEWFGYLLTLDTRQQKILGIIGSKRSGKGTIARVITALLGRDSIAGPALADLGTNFGLAPLIGKSAAIISDARLGGRVDMARIVERLLNLSGEDAVSIDRKYLSAWTGYLSARFMLISNELPAFNETSGALANRFVVLELTESFLGREDHSLSEKLIGSRMFPSELPGILLWAIEGWERLRERGHFLQPESSANLIDDIAELASPVKAWLRQRCDHVPGQQYRMKDAYADYIGWAAEQGHKVPLTSNMFGRNLRAIGIKPGAVPSGAFRGDKSYAGIMRKPDLKDYPPPRARRSNRETDGSEPE